MFITDLFEAQQKTVLVIYPGRFQPFHKGHKAVYDHLVSEYGNSNVFISTSNKVDPPRSPFDFSDKLRMMQLTGVNKGRVVQSKQPYISPEIVNTIDKENTIVLFAVSEKDMAEDPRFKFGPKKDGSPSYFQAMPDDLSQAQTSDKHAYITTVPTMDFTVLGKPANSATQIRAAFGVADEKTKKRIIKDLFGKYDEKVYKLMTNKVTEMHINDIFEDEEKAPQHAHAEQEQEVNARIQAMSEIAKVKFPYANSPQEALALYILDREETDSKRADQERAENAKNIAKVTELENALSQHVENLQQQINDLKAQEPMVDEALNLPPDRMDRTSHERHGGYSGEGHDLVIHHPGPHKAKNNLINTINNLKNTGWPEPNAVSINGWGPIHYDEVYAKEGIDGTIKVYNVNGLVADTIDSLMDQYGGMYEPLSEDAAGVGVIAKNKKMAKDPRYSMSMTNDVKPGTDAKNRKALKLEAFHKLKALQKLNNNLQCLKSTLQ